ncbi:MAG: 7-cyano-7-deazaguanine synthase [Acidiferrobacteraceae bacterium]
MSLEHNRSPITGTLLLSGGIESATLMHDRCGPGLAALFIDYGQRAARQEALAAQRQCDHLGVPMATLDARAIGRDINALRPARFHVPLPGRNLFILGAGVNWALAARATHLYLGVNAEDGERDPSALPGSLARLAAVIGEIAEIRIEAPYLSLSKSEILQRGTGLGVDYMRTYSCLRGRKRHCGRCPQCLARRAAMAGAGIDEHDDFYESG